MDRTDEELDRDWKPSGQRPQSTMARSFSAELMDIFRIENSLTDLDGQVDQRKKSVNRNTQELASLEARIREMEDRLKNRGISGLSSSATAQQSSSSQPQKKDEEKAKSRPGTAKATQKAPSAGNMPPTPGASEDGDGE